MTKLFSAYLQKELTNDVLTSRQLRYEFNAAPK